MKKREYADYIQDILDAIDSIENFVKGISLDDFKNDKKTYFAVIRAFEIIGEAANNAYDGLKDKYPQLPWRQMITMRNKVIHEYFGVDLESVWNTIEQDLPELKSHISNLKAELTIGKQ